MDTINQLIQYFRQFSEHYLAIDNCGLFQNRSNIDPADPTRCSKLALELDVSDYDIFVRANEWYHGRNAISVDRDFKIYLLSGCNQIPYYVRKFLRDWQPSTLAA